MENVRIGILGLGAISGIYLKNLTGLFKETEVVGIYDLIPEKMEQAQKEYGIPKAYSSMEEMFQDKDIEPRRRLFWPESMFTVKNLWLPPLKKEKNSLLWHRKKAFCWEALPIPSWVPLSRPAAN